MTSRPNDSISSPSAIRVTMTSPHRGSRSRRGERETDPRRSGDDFAPVPRWQGRGHPRQHPSGGDERVAQEPDREHPPTQILRDVRAQNEEQERIHLHVEPRAQLLIVVCVRRAIQPSTASSASAGTVSPMSSGTETGAVKDVATSAVTRPTSDERIAVDRIGGTESQGSAPAQPPGEKNVRARQGRGVRRTTRRPRAR